MRKISSDEYKFNMYVLGMRISKMRYILQKFSYMHGYFIII